MASRSVGCWTSMRWATSRPRARPCRTGPAVSPIRSGPRPRNPPQVVVGRVWLICQAPDPPTITLKLPRWGFALILGEHLAGVVELIGNFEEPKHRGVDARRAKVTPSGLWVLTGNDTGSRADEPRRSSGKQATISSRSWTCEGATSRSDERRPGMYRGEPSPARSTSRHLGYLLSSTLSIQMGKECHRHLHEVAGMSTISVKGAVITISFPPIRWRSLGERSRSLRCYRAPRGLSRGPAKPWRTSPSSVRGGYPRGSEKRHPPRKIDRVVSTMATSPNPWFRPPHLPLHCGKRRRRPTARTQRRAINVTTPTTAGIGMRFVLRGANAHRAPSEDRPVPAVVDSAVDQRERSEDHEHESNSLHIHLVHSVGAPSTRDPGPTHPERRGSDRSTTVPFAPAMRRR